MKFRTPLFEKESLYIDGNLLINTERRNNMNKNKFFPTNGNFKEIFKSLLFLTLIFIEGASIVSLFLTFFERPFSSFFQLLLGAANIHRFSSELVAIAALSIFSIVNITGYIHRSFLKQLPFLAVSIIISFGLVILFASGEAIVYIIVDFLLYGMVCAYILSGIIGYCLRIFYYIDSKKIRFLLLVSPLTIISLTIGVAYYHYYNSTHNSLSCEKYYKSSYFQEVCYLNTVVINKDIKICDEKLSLYKEDCYRKLFIATQDPKICERMRHYQGHEAKQLQQEICFGIIDAIRKKDSSFCNEINDGEIQKLCIEKTKPN